MNCPLARPISVETLGVLGLTGSLTVNVDPLPVPNPRHMATQYDEPSLALFYASTHAFQRNIFHWQQIRFE